MVNTMDLDDAPLDFETEDPLLVPSLLQPKRSKVKVIGLDDLLADYYKEQNTLIEKEAKAKKPRIRKHDDSDDEEDDDQFSNNKEVLLSQFVNACEKQVQEIKAEEDIPLWDLRVFGEQKASPALVFPELGNCSFLQSFMNNDLNAELELNAETGQTFLEGLLTNGWLPELIFTCGHVEKHVAIWTFNLMLYSQKEELRASAYNLWGTVLQSKDEVGPHAVRIDWLPSYDELKRALDIYGYLLDFSMEFSSSQEMSHNGSDSEFPAQNIRFWVKFVAACCRVRDKVLFSCLDVGNFLDIIISFFLDRRLQGLSLLLHECMLSVTNSFTDNEWIISCEKVAKSLACRVPKDLNCLRLVECISGVDTRSKQLRSELALQVLINCFDRKVSDGEEILRLLMSINVKAKDCNFFMNYIYLVLTENWLLSNPVLEEKPYMRQMWSVYLRNCSCQISSTDMRSYASKVRNKASYLLQSAIHE